MILEKVKIKNFRGYQTETEILISNLTALIGKNEAGKSSVLDALEAHMEEKIAIYTECMTKFPNSAEVFQPKIDKARKTMKLFPQIIEEYFSE